MTRHGSEEFWVWFKNSVQRIEDGLSGSDESITVEVDRRVQTLLGSQIRWEIGPREEDGLFFALGLSGNKGNLERNQNIIANAPGIPGWTFLHAKPRKSWASTKIVLAGHLIDFTDWMFKRSGDVLRVNPDGAATDRYSTTQLEGLAWLLVEGLLGEENALSAVAEIRIESPPPGITWKPFEGLASSLMSEPRA